MFKTGRRWNEVCAVLFGAGAFVSLLALSSYSPLDPSFNSATALDAPGNLIGRAGSYSSDLLFQIFGLSAFLLPVVLGTLAWKRARSEAIESPIAKATGLTLLVASLGGGFGLFSVNYSWQFRGAIPPGGLVGRLLADGLLHLLNVVGTLVLLSLAFLSALYLLTTFSLTAALPWLKSRFGWIWTLAEKWTAWREGRSVKTEQARRERAERELQKKRADLQKEIENQKKSGSLMPLVKVRLGPVTAPPPTPAPSPVSAPVSAKQPEPEPVDAITRMHREQEAAAPKPAPVPKAAPVEKPAPVERAAPVSVTQQPPPPPPKKPVVLGKPEGFRLPSSALLQQPDMRPALDEDDLRRLAQVLTMKCGEFDVTGTVTQINPGPVVTTFEFKPEAGIKYSRITNLVDDLCLAMEAESILIDRIPGKSTVGIEVPNAKRETIALREIVESPEFSGSISKLTLSLGKDINGRLRMADLNTMPNLLMAGSTGTGKSVCLKSFLDSML